MNKYTRHGSEFHIERGIIGFQQVVSNSNKVFIWIRDKIERPEFQDRHKTTRMANNTERKPDWVKSVWTKDKVFQHLEKQLKALDIGYQDLIDLADDAKSDKWTTNGDGDRNFLKAVIPNAVSEITGQEFRGQLTQHKGQAPESVYNRALEESKSGLHNYEELLNKYKNRAVVKTFAKVYTEHQRKIITARKLKKVYMEEGDKKFPVYEDKEVILGKPHNIFLEYKIPNELPVDIIPEEETTIKTMTLVKENKERVGEPQLHLSMHERKSNLDRAE